MSVNGPVEPAAELRQIAAFVRAMYLALVNEGFSEQQALTILGHMISSRPQS